MKIDEKFLLRKTPLYMLEAGKVFTLNDVANPYTLYMKVEAPTGAQELYNAVDLGNGTLVLLARGTEVCPQDNALITTK